MQGRALGDFAVSCSSLSPNAAWVSSFPLCLLPYSIGLSLFLMTLWSFVGTGCIPIAQPPSGYTMTKASLVPEGWSQCPPRVDLGFWSDQTGGWA